jgi:hypothetical protein
VSRRVENAVILDGPAAAMLSQAANLDALRVSVRGRDDRLHSLLVDIALTSAAWRGSAEGKAAWKPKEIADPETKPVWTPADVAKHLRVHPRTIRNDIGRGLLIAHKNGRAWTISATDAISYLESRKTP